MIYELFCIIKHNYIILKKYIIMKGKKWIVVKIIRIKVEEKTINYKLKN
jgi:hypothetical protein